jgi:hypothetical protein
VLEKFVDVEQALLHCSLADYPPPLALRHIEAPVLRQPVTLG